MDRLPYQLQEHFSVPEVDLLGETLVWQSGCDSGWINHPSNLVFKSDRGTASPLLLNVYRDRVRPKRLVPIAGCFEDFLKLANATPERVHAFVQERGVLGIYPLVQAIPGLDGEHHGRYRYVEAVSLYIQLARQARQMVRAMGSILDGRQVQKKDFEACLKFYEAQGGGGVFKWGQGRDIEVYDILVHCVKMWEERSAFELKFGGTGRREVQALQHDGVIASQDAITPLKFYVFFPESKRRSFDSHLRQQYKMGWDQWAALRYREGDRIAHTDGFGKPIESDSPYSELKADAFPISSQRFSPLFSALTFELLQYLTLPKGHYFCGFCGDLYNYLVPVKKGATKLRRDRSVSFCSGECQKEYKKAKSRRQYKDEKEEAGPSS